MISGANTDWEPTGKDFFGNPRHGMDFTRVYCQTFLKGWGIHKLKSAPTA